MSREMKDSGVEWIGEIPTHWEVRKLSDVAERVTDFVASGSFASLKKNVEYLDTPDYAMLVRTVDLSKKMKKKHVYINETAYKFLSNSNLFGGEIILPNIGSVGDVYMYTPIYKRASLAPNSILVDMKEDNRYYYYYFSSPSTIETLKNIGSDSIQLKFNKTQLRQLRVLRPPFNEQSKVAKFLDQKVLQIDEIINQTKSTIEDYKLLKQSIITEAVTKGLDKNVEMKDSGIEWIGLMPAHWDVLMLSQISEQVKNKNIDLSETNLLSLSYGHIVKRDINTTDGLLPESFNGYNIIEAGDIVLRLTDLQNDKTSLRVGIAREKGIITSAYVTIRSKYNINPDYLFYYMYSFDIYKGFYGMGAGVRQGLNYNGLKKLKIVIPDTENQQAIVEFIETRISKIEELIRKKETLLLNMESYKKSLIYEYVTGKKGVI